MNKDTGKTKEQLLAELEELRIKSSEQEEKLSALNQQLAVRNQQLEANNQQLIASEKLLRESEGKYSILADNMEIGLVLHKPDTKVIYCNQTAEKILGLTKELMTGKKAIDHSWEFVQKDGTPLPLEEYPVNKAIESKKPIKDYVLGVNIPGGRSHKWVSVNAVPVLDKNGIISYVSITFINITERKLAEEIIIQQKDFLNNVMESLTHPFYVIDINDYSILKANSASGFDLGINKTTCHALTHNSDVPCNSKDHLCSIETIKKTRKPAKVEHIHFDEAGNKKNVEVYSYPIFDKNEDISSIIEYSLDITERKLAEEALQKTLKKHASLIANIGDVIGIMGVDGIMKYKSPNIEKWFGWKPEDLVGKDGWGTVHPEDIMRLQKEFLTLLKKEDASTTVEYRYKCKDNTYTWIELTAINCTNDPNIEGVLLNYHDITERKQAEEAIKQSEEKFRALYDNAPLSYQSLNEDGSFKDVNPTWLSSLGYERDEVIGKFYKDYLHPDYKLHFEKNFPAFKKRGYVHDVQFKIRHKEGHYLDILFEGCVGYNPDGSFKQTYCVFQDITDRKQAEDKQKQSEERYRSLVDTVNSGVAIYKVINDGNSGSDYIIQDFNLFALKHEKMKKEDVIGKSLKEIRPNIDEYGLIDVFRKVWKTEESTYFPAKVYIDENYSNYYENRVFKLPSGEIVAIYDDVTERETARLELTNNEQKLKNIIENSTNLFYSHSVDEIITFISPQVKEILGYDPKEVFKNWTEFITDNPMNEKASEYTKKAIQTGQRQPTYELEMLRKDGDKIVVEVREAPIVENGEVVSIVGSLADITERKKSEKQMRFLSAITENMHDSIIVTDVQGHITYINKSTEKLFGYTLDELVGKSPDIFNIDSKAGEILAELYETVAKGEVYQGEALNRRKDGSEFICEFTVAPMTDVNGVVSSCLGIQRDITEIRNLENAAIRQERLSAIGELASGVAHDFNNALQIIMGGVEMAMASEEPEELNQYLESIKHSAGDAASHVRQLQRFSQIRHTQKESVPININNLAEDVIKETKLLLNQFQEKGIHFEINSDYKARTNIAGDEGELRACLFNIIKNSTEAMPEGGKITISTNEYDDKIYVSVSDTGTGMDNETEKKIFQPFYSTKGFEPGRGLGMAQVYSAIRDHNGDVYIKENVIGKGTVIEFAIPVSKKELILEKKEEEYVGTARILLVDDEEMIRTLGEKMLEMLGHTADLAANGNEALEFLARGNTYDLVITDIGMPGMSGWQLAEQIKDKGYTTRIAVVTGWGTEVSEEEKKRHNVGYVLGKPINLKDLKALIGEVLQMKNISGKDNL